MGIEISIDDFDKYDIRDLEKILHKRVGKCIDTLFGNRTGVPDDNDHFTYNEVRACYLKYIGAPDYFITEMGDVYREYKNGKVSLVKQIFVNGKWNVTTSTHCIVKRYVVHKLVAECFVPNLLGYKSVVFIDGDVNNLKASNLEWKEIDMSHHGNGKGAPKKPIEMYDKYGNFICEYESVSDCAITNGWNMSNISCVLRGRQSTAYGHTFRYKNHDEI